MSQSCRHPAVPSRSEASQEHGTERKQGEKETPKSSWSGRSPSERSHPKLCLLKRLPSWKSPREALAAGCGAGPLPWPCRQGARGCPQLPSFPNPACIFGSDQGPPRSPFQQPGRTKHSLVLGTSSRRCRIALPNPDQHLLVPARQLSCQHMPGWPRFPAPPPAPSFNWTSLAHAENTRGLVSTRTALTPGKGGDPTLSRPVAAAAEPQGAHLEGCRKDVNSP